MIFVIGISTAGRDGLSKKALGAVARASVMMGATRHTSLFPQFEGERIGYAGGIKGALDKVEKALTRGKKDAVILATGDPLFFGIGGKVVERFGKRKVEVIPNISIVQEAFARIKENASGVVTLSVHGGEDKGRGIEAAIEKIISSEKAAIFTDPKNTPDAIAKALIERGVKGRKAYVFEALGTEREKITHTCLKGISRRKFDPLNLMVVYSKAPLVERLAFTPGLPDKDFYSPDNMMTKSEVRAVTISKLRPVSGEIVWDVGAGSGTVSIEAALSAPTAKIIAIEKKPARIKSIKENIKRFKVSNIEVVKGAAPDALKSLPRPDAVFVGGGGKDAAKILAYAAKRLNPGGRVIVNAVTQATLETALGFFKRRNWKWDSTEVAVSRSEASAGKKAKPKKLNTVTIIKGRVS